MLTRANRLTSSRVFAQTARRGRKAARRTMVAHLSVAVGDAPVQVGLVVGKNVGPAVVRNLVKRRLRHLMRERLAALPRGGVLVVRARPAAAGASYAELAADLDVAVGRVTADDMATSRVVKRAGQAAEAST